jgi:CDP-paratose 2-epimerase
VLVQEYGRYFGLRSACFRGGTLTGPDHAATELHGFLAYVMRCTMAGLPYTVFGYGGKQVRDVISSADVVTAFERFLAAPRTAEVYNLGGGRTSNVSVLEAIALAEEIAGRELEHRHETANRVGDHIWWISSTKRFEEHYPGWRVTADVPQILRAMHEANAAAWTR